MNRRVSDVLMVYCVLWCTACGGAIEREAFCGQMAQAICTRLFECNAKGAGGLRYTDQSGCEGAEAKTCRALATDDSLAFDGDVAFSCVEEVESAACERVLRADFHTCEDVFTGLDRPSKAIDAGTD